MTTSITHHVSWDDLKLKLQAPFDPADVDFRIQGRANEKTGKAQVLAYIDARTVQDRLDEEVGIGNWSFDWEPTVIEKGEVLVAKGTLTIYGVSKSDAGSASNFEQSMGAVSHCFKRAAVMWGIGRYLYDIEKIWVEVPAGATSLSSVMMKTLRDRLPRPKTPEPQDPTPIRATVANTIPTERAEAIEKKAWVDLQLRHKALGFTLPQWEEHKKKYPTVAKMAAALDDFEKRRLNLLKRRANELGWKNEEWETALKETGGNYEQMRDRVEAVPQTVEG